MGNHFRNNQDISAVTECVDKTADVTVSRPFSDSSTSVRLTLWP